jgi:hypothetical protein
MKRTTLERRTPLVSRSKLETKKPLRAKAPMARVSAKPKGHHPERTADKATRGANGPVRDPGFLAFVRTQSCDCCGTTTAVEAHHWGKHGVATKCSDHEVIPLCHAHHVEGWHRHGTLPGRTRDEWLERWAQRSTELLADYRTIPGRRRPPARSAGNWRREFLRAFADVEPGDEGAVDADFERRATEHLLARVWPTIPDRDEWTPVLSWHHGELLVQAEHLGGRGVFDLDLVLAGSTQDAA